MNRAAFLRGATLSRRSVLGLALAGGVSLAACGVKGKQKPPPTRQEIATFWSGQERHGKVNFANWPLYMDEQRTQLKEFTRATGTKVNYQEVIQDDPSWFGRIQPQLAAGQSIGYDLMVVTNGIELTKLQLLGYLVPLDHSKLPNYAKNAGPTYKREVFDPGNVYTIPWTSGITGIGYNPKYVKKEITSIEELWNPAYAGKVGMFSATDELGYFGMYRSGIDPATAGPAEWKKAAATLKEQRDKGIVRAYYDQTYIKSLANGDLWITMAWSGDIFQQNVSEGTGLKFVIPKEGGSLWTDNMCIPISAENPLDALELMDFFYDPKIAAGLTEYINYVTPVPSTQQVIRADAAAATGDDKESLEAVASSPLVYPSASDYARLHSFRPLTPTEDRTFQDIFQPITQG
ncbi:polyamine ABC transporter substrate-binding protein [Fodinicola acaciae]|uniref:polyamine ABC transporter substrate-binding protein n=1 Tax=Fodinicola acaciae TaxID=2681555 RepID=UPI0016521B33|nr:spermidine/putrescine ABC transporter substrate-binding protein [Fodinicola acaciae]